MPGGKIHGFSRCFLYFLLVGTLRFSIARTQSLAFSARVSLRDLILCLGWSRSLRLRHWLLGQTAGASGIGALISQLTHGVHYIITVEVRATVCMVLVGVDGPGIHA